MDDQNYNSPTPGPSLSTDINSQWSVQKPKRSVSQILFGILAVMLVVGVAGASYYVSNQLSTRQTVAPTAPEGSQAACKNDAGCKKTETCRNGVCKLKSIVNATPTAYACTATNCPGPNFYCSSKTNCAISPGYGTGGGGGGATVTPVNQLKSCGPNLDCQTLPLTGGTACYSGTQLAQCCNSGQIIVQGACMTPSTNPGLCSFCSAGKCVVHDVKGCTQSGSCYGDSQCAFTGASTSKTLCSYCSNGECIQSEAVGCLSAGSCTNKASCTNLPACGAGGLSCSGSALQGGTHCRQSSGADGYCCSSGQTIVNNACVSSSGGGGGGTTVAPTKTGGGGGGGGSTTTTTTTPAVTATPAPTTAPIVAGACMEIQLYGKKADGTFSITPMTVAEKAAIKMGDTLRLVIKGNKSNLLARFRVWFNGAIMALPGPVVYPEAPNQRPRVGFLDPQTRKNSYYDFTATRAGEYKFEGFVSTNQIPQTCGGIAGVLCPTGEHCVMPINVPDASGTCQPNTAK